MDLTYKEMFEYLKEQFKYEDEFELNEAIFWFSNHYHTGMFSNLYKAIAETQFEPSILFDEKTLENNELYQELVYKFGYK